MVASILTTMFTKKAKVSLRNFCRLLTADCRLLLRPRNHSKNNTAPPERKKSDPQLLLRKYRFAGAEKIRPAIIATKIPLRWSGKNQTPNYCYENTAPLERVKSDPQLLLRKYRSAGAKKT
jgi:hypothetical protein